MAAVQMSTVQDNLKKWFSKNGRVRFWLEYVGPCYEGHMHVREHCGLLIFSWDVSWRKDGRRLSSTRKTINAPDLSAFPANLLRNCLLDLRRMAWSYLATDIMGTNSLEALAHDALSGQVVWKTYQGGEYVAEQGGPFDV